MKTTIRISLLFICAVLLSACQTPKMLADQELKTHADIYSVKGRNGLLIKQKINFGPYHTRYIKRGWTSTYRLPFFVTFSGAHEKVTFSLTDSINTAVVSCFGRIKRQELNVLGNFFGVRLKLEDVFSGNLHIAGDTTQWHFFVENASNTDPFMPTEGFAESSEGKIIIKAIREVEGKNNMLTRTNIFGYQFFVDERAVCAVEVINKGRVMMVSDLDPRKKLILSALSTALMVKRDLNDAEAELQ